MDKLHISYFDSNIIKLIKLSPLKADTIKTKQKKPSIIQSCMFELSRLALYIRHFFVFKIRGSNIPTVW